MERMDVRSRNEYLKGIKESYLKTRNMKEKTQLLDEYCRSTGQARKYVIWKIHRAVLKPGQRKKGKEIYDNQVKAALAKIWETSDYPCGQRLMESQQLSEEAKKKLQEIYLSLNTTHLKRQIDVQLEKLYRVYEDKNKTPQAAIYQNLPPHIVRNYMIKQSSVGLGT